MVDINNIETTINQVLADFGVLIVNLSFVVQHGRIQRLAILVFFDEEAFGTGLAKDAASDGVANGCHKLAIFVIRNLSFVHEERSNLHLAGLRSPSIGDVLHAGTHGVVALVDKHHAFEVNILKVRAVVDTNYFSVVGGFAAPKQGCRCGENEKQLLHIVNVLFILKRIIIKKVSFYL